MSFNSSLSSIRFQCHYSSFDKLFILVFFFFLPSSSLTNFSVTRFQPGLEDILYEGGAEASVGVVDFNSITYRNQVGRATYSKPVQIWDSDSGRLSDFRTNFRFTIDTRVAPAYGSGLVFFLAPVGFPIPPNSGGGFLGLFNRTTSHATSTNHIVLVEFDTFPDDGWDPDVRHIGINVNSITPAAYVPWNASLYSNQIADVWVNYNASTKNLSVLLTYSTNSSNDSYRVSYTVDLSITLPEWVTIGFSAATGCNIERHMLHFWEFNSSLDVKVAKAKKGKNDALTISLVISAGVLICGVGVAWIVVKRKYRTKKEEKTANLTSMNNDFERGVGPKRFSYRELASATNNFSDKKKLGQGGFGGVYRGFLSNIEQDVAVKKISQGSKQGKKEYATEVKIISRLRHRNLVQLIGWCHDRGQFLLVYEFMPNGSLDTHLFGKQIPLSWDIRYKIALGLASALVYLHEEWEQCVVHRDIKSSNVMLDSNFNVKLGDFGLAKLMDHEMGPQTTGLAGTLGYLAPEYFRTGRASKESDVFSFGIVAMEIACGRRPVCMKDSDVGLIEWAWDQYGRGELLSVADERLHMHFDADQMRCLMIVGLWCAHPDKNLRPTIRQAIQVLHFETMMPSLPSRMPVPMYHETSSSDQAAEPWSTDASIVMGR